MTGSTGQTALKGQEATGRNRSSLAPLRSSSASNDCATSKNTHIAAYYHTAASTTMFCVTVNMTR